MAAPTGRVPELKLQRMIERKGKGGAHASLGVATIKPVKPVLPDAWHRFSQASVKALNLHALTAGDSDPGAIQRSKRVLL